MHWPKRGFSGQSKLKNVPFQRATKSERWLELLIFPQRFAFGVNIFRGYLCTSLRLACSFASALACVKLRKEVIEEIMRPATGHATHTTYRSYIAHHFIFGSRLRMYAYYIKKTRVKFLGILKATFNKRLIFLPTYFSCLAFFTLFDFIFNLSQNPSIVRCVEEKFLLSHNFSLVRRYVLKLEITRQATTYVLSSRLSATYYKYKSRWHTLPFSYS